MDNIDNNTSFENKLRELSTIRDILMGDEMALYAQKFKDIEVRFERNAEENAENLHNLTVATAQQVANLNARIDALSLYTSDRFDRLERLLQENVDTLNKKIAKASTNDKAQLGKMLANIAQKLATDPDTNH